MRSARSSRAAPKRTWRTLYALPAFVLALPTIPAFVLLPTFYAETMGLGLATVGAIFLGLRLLDVISDPILGWASDQVPAHLGKRKLPIAIGAVVAGPALIMIFSPPPDVGLMYLTFWGALLYVGWTAVQIPYVAWAVDLEPEYQARASLNGLREGAGLLGILATGAMGVIFAEQTQNERFALMAWITVILGAGVIGIALRFVPERRPLRDLRARALTFPWGNKVFLRVIIAWFINGLANGLPAVCLPLFMVHILQADEQTQAVLLFIYFLFAVFGIGIWVFLARRWSKHRVWATTMILTCVVFAYVPFLSAGDAFAFGVICALTGMTLGSDLALPPAIQADCADWDRLRYQHERTATLFAYWSMATKLALGAAVGLAFPVLGALGLDGDTVAPPAIALTALVVIYAALPIVLKIAAVALMWNFPIGRGSHRAIQRALERKS